MYRNVFLLLFIFLVPADLPRAAGDAVSERELVVGLKDALRLSARKAVTRLGQEDGFLLNPRARIPLPQSLSRIDGTVRRLGLGRYPDELLTAMNRAAEAAVPEAGTLLVEAVNKMTISEAREIVRGGHDAATRYFRKQTEVVLTARFLPIVQRATKTTRVAEAYNQYAGRAVRHRLLDVEDAKLDQYVTRKALDGLFLAIADEERAIRANPLQQTQLTLRKVFGALEQ